MYNLPRIGFRIPKKVTSTTIFLSCRVPFYSVAVFQFVVLPYQVIF